MSHNVQLGPAWDLNHSFVQHVLPVSYLVAISLLDGPLRYFSACVQVTLFHLISAPKCKSSDAGNLDMPKRNSKRFPFIEKVKVFNIERKLYAKVTTVKSVHERAWQAPVHEVVRVRQNLVTEAPPPLMKL